MGEGKGKRERNHGITPNLGRLGSGRFGERAEIAHLDPLSMFIYKTERMRRKAHDES